MAKLDTPLLSLRARGSLANSVSFANNRNRPQARAYARPTNPQTPAQQTHRADVATAVAYWHNATFTANMAPAWALHARTYRTRGTGYHAWMHNSVPIIKYGRQQGMVWASGPWIGNSLPITLIAPFYVGIPAIPGTFDIHYGDAPNHLHLTQHDTIFVGRISLDTTDWPQDYIYYEVSQLGLFRSGIVREDEP